MNPIYIESETLDKAARNTSEAIQEAKKTIRDGNPEEIREAMRKIIELSAIQRAFIRANYNL